jgi:hypothetical protein
MQIRFTTLGSCSAFGDFSPGDTARLDARLAAHLVNDAHCAEYITTGEPEAVSETKPRRKAKDQP